MHTYIAIAILFTLVTTAEAKGKWGAGAADGWGMTQTPETITQYSTPTGPAARYKIKVRRSGPLAGIAAGYSRETNTNIYGFIIGTYKDYYQIHQGPKNDILEDMKLMNKNTQKNYTFEISGKISHFISHTTKLYTKLGVLRSQFREQFIDPVTNIRHRGQSWGGILGFGIHQSYESVKVGLEYTYHHYGHIGTSMQYVLSSDTFKTHSKFHPQYHAIRFGISKSF